MSSAKRLRAILSFACLAVLLIASPALAQGSASPESTTQLGPSGLPLPRFVSLGSGEANMRIGPGTQYAVKWVYKKPGLPLEILQEYGNWRRVRDADGAEGWMHHSLLSGQRTGVITPWFREKKTLTPLLRAPRDGAAHVASVEPGAIGSVVSCTGEWCRMRFSGPTGWMRQSSIWGVYPGEAIEE